MDIELHNGGGNNNNVAVVPSFPNPADPRARELQPFTWRRAAPYIAAILAGVALCAVGWVRMRSHPCPAAGAADDANRQASDTNGCADELGFVLAVVGLALVVIPAYMAWTDLACACCARRLDQAP